MLPARPGEFHVGSLETNREKSRMLPACPGEFHVGSLETNREQNPDAPGLPGRVSRWRSRNESREIPDAPGQAGSIRDPLGSANQLGLSPSWPNLTARTSILRHGSHSMRCSRMESFSDWLAVPFRYNSIDSLVGQSESTRHLSFEKQWRGPEVNDGPVPARRAS